MSGTIGSVKPPSGLYTEEPDNATGDITAQILRNLAESAFSLPASPNSGTAKTTNYTAALTDRGSVVSFNAASAAGYTIPPNSSVAFAVGTVLSAFWLSGAAAPTWVAGAGVTINQSSPATLAARAQFSIIYAWQYAANTWLAFGDLR